MSDKLSTYQGKRRFHLTPEPRGEVATPGERLRFVVQKHAARKLHYDFRLELDGTLKSWAVPKGPSLDPEEKRLAVHVEDHPLDYIDFEGDIPPHQYGAGHVDVWDIGYWEPLGDPAAAYHAGKLKFRLAGEKLHGGWTLVKTHLPGSGGKEQWLLIKERDEHARPGMEFDITAAMPGSVLREFRARKDMRAGTPSSKRRVNGKTPGTGPGAPDPAALENAVKTPLPETLSPQLATLVDTAPQSGSWAYEIKFDGYRILARIDKEDVRLLTRDGKNWTAKLPRLAKALRSLGLRSAWLDGEIVAPDRQGIPSFQLLQNAFDGAFDQRSTAQILFFLFDLPYLNGFDLRKTPLSQRRRLLQDLLANVPEDQLRFSATIDQPPQKLLESACALSMEGIIGKRADSLYSSGRGTDWIKLKCRKSQEFVIGGYTEPQGSRKFFGALLLGTYDDDGALRYAGRVGTGFDQASLHAIHQRLKPLEQRECPFTDMPEDIGRVQIHWVKPQLAAEISFAEWTQDGMLRQAVFHGLRIDKLATQIRREEAASTPKPIARRAAPTVRGREDDSVQGFRITHARRVIDPSSGLTKLDLAHYYDRVAPHLLPFLSNRPVYLLRAPEGIGGEQFFQKHSNRMAIPGITTLDPALDPGHAPLMTIDSAQALIGAAQMGTVELHTCNATADLIEKPDCMVFDLDPDPELPWTAVVESAHLTKVVLDELGLQSFLKTSGGKGLHLVVPLARRHDWDTVAAFSQAVAQHLARTIPSRFSAKMGAKNRVGKIFVDYLRNRRKASTVAPYSVRARPELPVAVPIAWEELKDITGAAMWTIVTLPDRLAQMRDDPWRNYFQTKQTLTEAMKKKLGLTRK